jgi:hypothetical protein
MGCQHYYFAYFCSSYPFTRQAHTPIGGIKFHPYTKGKDILTKPIFAKVLLMKNKINGLPTLFFSITFALPTH